ncbi:MAG: bifunctional DNA primase/polymerase [Chloroflexota bacterium]
MTEKATKHGLYVAACRFLAAGFSIVPCNSDKRPAKGWRELQIKRATTDDVQSWYLEQSYKSIGLVGGRISGNVVFIDLDGIPAIQMFAKEFPQLCETTHSVLTGSQKGIHLYVRVDEIPDNINVRVDGIGGFEIRGNGQYVIAPPSPHPSGYRYRVHRNHEIQHLTHIQDIHDWMLSLRAENDFEREQAIQQAQRPHHVDTSDRKRAYLSTVVSEKVASIETASVGNRNNALFKAGCVLANFVAGRELVWLDVQPLLLQAGLRTGMTRIECERTLQSAYRIGSKRVRTVS